MKKFVIIALIFALAAGAAFAQSGDWSVSGQGEIGTTANFAAQKEEKSPMQGAQDGRVLSDNDITVAKIGASGYHNVAYYGFIGAQLGVKYTNGGISAGLNFESKLSDKWILGQLDYRSEVAAFSYEQSLKELFIDGSFTPQRLWGYYKFLDGKLHVEAAAKSRDTNYWYTSDVLQNLFGGNSMSGSVYYFKTGDNLTANPSTYFRALGATTNGDGTYMDLTFGKGFTDTDKHTYLAVDVSPTDGLSLGVLVPGVFAYNGANTGGGQGGFTGFSNANSGVWGYKSGAANWPNTHIGLLEDALLKSRIGAQFASGPLKLSAQFALLGAVQKREVVTVVTKDLKNNDVSLKQVVNAFVREDVNGDGAITPSPALGTGQADGTAANVINNEREPVKTIDTGLYLGATFSINEMLSAGLAFQGEFYSKKPILGFGANVGINAGALSADLAGGLLMIVDPSESLEYPWVTESKPDQVIGDDQKRFTGIYEFSRENIRNDTSDQDRNAYTIEKATYSWLAVKPSVRFTIVPNYLTFGFNTNLYWKLGLYDRKYEKDVFRYEVEPAFYFSVLGTGGGSYYGMPSGIIFRYHIAGTFDGSERRTMNKTHSYEDVNTGAHQSNGGPLTGRPVSYNAFDITFKWSF